MNATATSGRGIHRNRREYCSGGNSGTETEFLNYKKFGLRPRITAATVKEEIKCSCRFF